MTNRKSTTNGMKRNSVVIDREKHGYNFYKRVWRVVDDEHVITICCGLHVKLEHQDDLELTNYRGQRVGKHYNKMSTLRRLLKKAHRYNPDLYPYPKN